MSSRLFLNSVKAAAVSCVAALFLLLVLNTVSYQGEDPDRFLTIFAYAALIASSFVCGLMTMLFNREKALLCGLLSGGLYLLIIMIASLIVRSGEPLNSAALLVCAGALLASCAGSFAGLPRSPSTDKIRRDIRHKYISGK